MMLTPNPPIDRLNYIVKIYGEKQPWVVLDTLSVIFPTIGIDDPLTEMSRELPRMERRGEIDQKEEIILRRAISAGMGGRTSISSYGLISLSERLDAPYRSQLDYWWNGGPLGDALPSAQRSSVFRSEQLALLLKLASSPTFSTVAVEREFKNDNEEVETEMEDVSMMRMPSEADGIFPWVARELSKLSKYTISKLDMYYRPSGPGLRMDWSGHPEAPPEDWEQDYSEYTRAVDFLRKSGNLIAQWAKLKRVDLMKLSLAEVIEATKGFRYSAKVRQGEVVYKFGSGWTMQSLRGRRELEDEHKALNHCVNTYCDAVDRGSSVIYSLRDPDGVPYVTMEWNPSSKAPYYGEFAQVFGQGNSTIGSEGFNEYVFQAGQENKPPLTRGQVPEVVEAIRDMIVEFIEKKHNSEFGGIILAGARIPGSVTSIATDLDLRGYDHPLPAGLKSVDGYINLRDYKHPLPTGFESAGGLRLRDYKQPLPVGFKSVSGSLDLEGYNHPLPAGFKSVGMNLYLLDYKHPLPVGLKSVGGRLVLEGYNHPLPAGFESVGSDLYLEGYDYPLPAGLKSVGGHLYLRGYKHPLPDGFKSVGGDLYLRGYNHHLPAGFKRVGGNLDLRGYDHPLPAGLNRVGGNLYLLGYNHPLPRGLDVYGDIFR
jgi:hypothetical protein